MQDEKELIMHADCVSKFNANLYTEIFTYSNIISKKKALMIGKDKYYGYFLEKGNTTYFAESSFIDVLPFKIVESKETDFKTDVYTVITKVKSINIPAEKRIDFRTLVDISPGFRHTNPIHWTLANIILKTAYIDRINARIVTEAGFGKDSVVNNYGQLVNSTVNMYGATYAKLEQSLLNKVIVLNELGNLKKEDIANFQAFLLSAGGYFNEHVKRSRKNIAWATQEVYNISKLSIIVFYNMPEYYKNKSQEYFDIMFTKAVANRFIPFVFDGKIITEFNTIIDTAKIVKKYDYVYTDVIATLNYYKENPLSDIKYKVDKSILNFPDDLMRFDRTFTTILKYVAEYAQDQGEFDILSQELYNCYREYEKHI